jgi:glycosyltransferase involved in cell wall biosynthesis
MVKSDRQVFIGALPPPVHGMSIINSLMAKAIESRSKEFYIYNIVPSKLSTYANTKIWPLVKSVNVLRHLLSYFYLTVFRRPDSLFLSLAGGYGQLFEIPFLFLARMSHQQIFIHHHSFSYLNNKKKHAEILIKISGTNVKHLALCDDMAIKLSQLYGIDENNILTLSNAAFLANNSFGQLYSRDKLTTVGFISNICFDKGIRDFLDVAEVFELSMSDVQFVVAGPFINSTVKDYVIERINKSKNVQYCGPKYGDEKKQFFEEMDVLLFPTKYVNEAEPVTIFEALSFASPVIAFQRGCIKGMLADGGGMAVPFDEDFVSHSVACLSEWIKSPATFRMSSTEAKRRFELWKSAQENVLNEVLQLITGPIQNKDANA